MFINFPIVLTWLRMAMIPLLVGIFYLPDCWFGSAIRETWAAIFFIFAALTDWLDGWLARKWRQTSAFGAFLDPVADKLMVCAALLVLLNLDRVDAFVALVIIGREIMVSALREWMAKIGASASVAVHRLGKLKTVAQMVAVPCLFFDHKFGVPFQFFGANLIKFSAILTIWSMFYYLQKALPVLRKKNQLHQ